jgi:hypothetical protein
MAKRRAEDQVETQSQTEDQEQNQPEGQGQLTAQDKRRLKTVAEAAVENQPTCSCTISQPAATADWLMGLVR